MQEVTAPYGQGEEEEEWFVAHPFDRVDTLPYSLYRLFHLILYGHAFEEKVEQNTHRCSANARNDVASC